MYYFLYTKVLIKSTLNEQEYTQDQHENANANPKISYISKIESCASHKGTPTV